MADYRAILQRCDPALLDDHDDPDQMDCVEAARMDLYLTESRRVQKVVWRQLFVLDSMVALLEGQESAQQLMTLPCPPPPDGSARARWKALKAESRAGVEEMEGLFKSLERIEQIHERRQTLTQLVQRLHNKKQQTKQLVEALEKAQNALQSCDHQLIQLMAESEAVLSRLIDWQQLRDELQVYTSAVQDVIQINLLSFNQSELCLELRPRPTSRLSSSELEPLRLSITWSHDDRFRLQVNEGTAGLEEDSIVGRRSELSAALLEVMQCYGGQFELLSEIQGLRSSFAIDWRPTQRLLIYLKSALLVCHLEVEEGYPSSGRARLLSVRRDGQPVDTSELKPLKSHLSLTDWLVFLCSSPLI